MTVSFCRHTDFSELRSKKKHEKRDAVDVVPYKPATNVDRNNTPGHAIGKGENRFVAILAAGEYVVYSALPFRVCRG